MREVVPGVQTFRGLLMGRVYLLSGTDGLAIVDAGLQFAAGRILRQLARQGHQPGDVRRILITHGDGDHIGGLPDLQAATGAEVFASAVEAPAIEAKAGIPVTRTVEDGDTIEGVRGGLVVIATPGHSPGHVTYWQPERRIAFCGDVLMNMLGMTLPFAAFTVDMDEDKRSIARLLELEPEVLCVGHGPPLVENTTARLRAFAERVGAV